MKWLFIFLLMLTIQVSAQNGVKDFMFDKESFLIGTLDDTFGHQQTFTVYQDSSMYLAKDSAFIKSMYEKGYFSLQEMIESADEKYQFVDSYCLIEDGRKLALLIISLFSSEFPDLRMEKRFPRLAQNVEKCISLYSKSLTKIIDSYYDYRFSSSKTIFSDTVYRGYLKPEKFQTDSQKLSFLAGTMFRYLYKEMESERYFFSMPNSLNKANLCFDLLKVFGCKNIIYERIENNCSTVVSHTVYFEPSETISKLIEKVKTVKENFENDEALKIDIFG
jgi:hypothetical protein